MVPSKSQTNKKRVDVGWKRKNRRVREKWGGREGNGRKGAWLFELIDL